jgi:hypothetical protein
MGLRILLILGLLVCGGPVAAAQERSLEYPVKAAFLYRFGSFVDWPGGAFADDRQPLLICIIGHDPFGPTLDRLVAGQTVEGRTLLVRRLPAADPDAGCHIAYLGGSSSQSVGAAAHALAGEPVFTVAESAAPGVVAQFVLRANRVRFRLDTRAAAAARLRISSKLLNLAVEVTQ